MIKSIFSKLTTLRAEINKTCSNPVANTPNIPTEDNTKPNEHVRVDATTALSQLYNISQTNIEPFLVGGGRAKLNAEVMMKIEVSSPKNTSEQMVTKYWFLCNDSHLCLGTHRVMQFYAGNGRLGRRFCMGSALQTLSTKIHSNHNIPCTLGCGCFCMVP
jgi:hypothetical protein